MVASLEKIDRLIADAVHQPMLLRQTARPTAREKILERPGLAGPLEGIAHDCLHKIQHPDGGAPLVLDPKPQVFEELLLKDSDSITLSLHLVLNCVNL